MNKNDDFYIGWQDEGPRKYEKLGTQFFIFVLVILLFVAVIFTKSERGFIDSYFEYGTPSEIQGQLITEPVLGLRTRVGSSIKTIPLVGFGKHGADQAIMLMMGNNGMLKNGSQVTLRGTLFHYQERSWMELTEGENSLIAIHADLPFSRSIRNKGLTSLIGEIVDPKCFFGVMNPAHKAVHRSCAIRCISGGVPSMLAIRDKGSFVDYYFLVDDNFRPLTKNLLSLVGLPVVINGEHWVYDDWNVLQVSDALLSQARVALEYQELTLCYE